MKIFQAVQFLIKEIEDHTQMYVMMVGVPGVGKSSLISKFHEMSDLHIHVASTDDLIDIESIKCGITYNEAFNKLDQKQLRREMEKGILLAVSNNEIIFQDQTNMSSKQRSSKINLIPKSYYKICLNFNIDDDILKSRLDIRAQKTGKIIPEYVIKNMLSNYNIPSKSEGFDLIIDINNN